MKEMKQNEIILRQKGRDKKNFKTLLPNFVWGFNKGWHKFNIFCMDESEQDETKGFNIILDMAFFPKIEEIFNET